MNWERHLEFLEDEFDDGIPYEPDDRDYEMEEAAVNDEFWDEQQLDEYLLQEAEEKAALQEIIDKGESE